MVERAATPKVPVLRRRLLQAARAMTTPLLPDDYLGLLDPRWSTREATGTIVEVRPETDEASTVVIKPSHEWAGHTPGQYLRIGAEIDGVRRWRAYSITSDPEHPEGLLSITIKYVEDGLMSPWFLRQAKPGTLVFLGEVEGTFGLPDPLPAKILSISAGSGITPVMALQRQLDRTDNVTDVVHIHSARTPGLFIFGDLFRELQGRRPGYLLHERITSEQERITPQGLARMLQTAYVSGVMPELMASLPITGVDGTLRRSKSRVSQGWAHLKTGSLRDAAALAGYVHTTSGKRLVMVGVINHPNAAAARPALEALVDWAVKEGSK